MKIIDFHFGAMVYLNSYFQIIIKQMRKLAKLSSNGTSKMATTPMTDTCAVNKRFHVQSLLSHEQQKQIPMQIGRSSNKEFFVTFLKILASYRLGSVCLFAQFLTRLRIARTLIACK